MASACLRLAIRSVLFAAVTIPLACSVSPSISGGTPTDYFEHRGSDGRIYVVGSAETLKKVQAGEELLYRVTLVGGGPRAETVVIEASKDSEELQNRLRAAFAKKYGLPSS